MVGEVGLEPTKRKASRLQRDGIAANRLARMYGDRVRCRSPSDSRRTHSFQDWSRGRSRYSAICGVEGGIRTLAPEYLT